MIFGRISEELVTTIVLISKETTINLAQKKMKEKRDKREPLKFKVLIIRNCSPYAAKNKKELKNLFSKSILWFK